MHCRRWGETEDVGKAVLWISAVLKSIHVSLFPTSLFCMTSFSHIRVANMVAVDSGLCGGVQARMLLMISLLPKVVLLGLIDVF